jgi:hypothetical protein
MSPLSFNATLSSRAPAGCARNAWSILSVVQCSSMAMAVITLLWLMLPVFDAELAALGGSVTRRAARDVYAELQGR